MHNTAASELLEIKQGL